MKGVVFNLLEEVITRTQNADVWDQLLDTAGLEGAYTSLGNYPDAELGRLVATAAESLNQSPTELLSWFGREALPLLATRYPIYFTTHASTRPFLLSLNHIIQTEVRKLYPASDVPSFDFSHDADGDLLMGYQSARRLCALAQGFVEGAARHYREPISFEHLSCMHRGDPKCLFRIRFPAGQA